MTENIFLTHDNIISFRLIEDGVAQSLSAVTKITATFGAITVTSNDHENGTIKWNNAGYSIGEVRMDLGGENIPAGLYHVPIVIYDTDNLNGLVWGYMAIKVVDDVESYPNDLNVMVCDDANTEDLNI